MNGASSSALRVVSRHSAGGGVSVDVLGSAISIVIGEREVRLAQELAELPTPKVKRLVQSRWKRLASPSTSVEEAASLLDLDEPTNSPGSDPGICR